MSHSEMTEHRELTRLAEQDRHFVIYIGGEPGSWIARCYDIETSEHVWSSEGASTVRLALSEIERALTRVAEHSQESETP